MSVYIKGMEMPHDCDECKLCAFIPVGDYGINRKCMPLNAKAEITIRRTDCPLVPVPDHGRLIDADAVLRRYDYELSRTYTDDFAKGFQLGVKAAVGKGNAVVIEAEEGET